MTVTPEMIAHLRGGLATCCPIWKIISRDGTVAAYAAHTRKTVGRSINGAPNFIFGGVTYNISAVQNTRDMQKIGLNPNSTQLSGIFDTILTRVDVEGGRWKLAKVVYEYVNYLDLSIGSFGRISGVCGKWSPIGQGYQVEVMSNASLLQQQVGELTSPTDRNTFPAGINKADWTEHRTVTGHSADRRTITINGTAKPDDWFKYGVIKWTSGANSVYKGMEIKSNVGNVLELQLPMPKDIVDGADLVDVLAGYDGTRQQLRDKFGDMVNGNMEPDLPGLKVLFTYD